MKALRNLIISLALLSSSPNSSSEQMEIIPFPLMADEIHRTYDMIHGIHLLSMESHLILRHDGIDRTTIKREEIGGNLIKRFYGTDGSIFEFHSLSRTTLENPMDPFCYRIK